MKKIIGFFSITALLLFLAPEPKVEGQIGYQITAAQLSAAFPLTTNTTIVNDDVRIYFGTEEDTYISWVNSINTTQWIFRNGTSFVWSDAGAVDTTLSLIDYSALAGSRDILDLDATLGAMDGSDTVRGLFVDLTNADHTGSSNLLYGLQIDSITGDAQASEYGVAIGSGWDGDIQFTSSGEIIVDATLVGTFFDTTSQPKFLVNGNISDGGKGVALDNTALAMDGSDTIVGFLVDLTNADHTGSTNLLLALDVDGITADAEASEVLMRVGTGWEAFLSLDNVALGTHTMTTNADKTGNAKVGTLEVCLDDQCSTVYHIQLYAN